MSNQLNFETSFTDGITLKTPAAITSFSEIGSGDLATMKTITNFDSIGSGDLRTMKTITNFDSVDAVTA